MIQKIISGGQTGVDRAALDAARACGVAIGGWCPKGRRAEDGPIPAHYPLQETPSEDYGRRTAWNVRDSDATLILSRRALSGGTALTLEEAQRQGKPVYVCRFTKDPDTRRVHQWVVGQHVRVLNIAGPRETEAPGIYAAARAWLTAFLSGFNAG